MIGLDTNVLIRYLTQDDRKQAARATRLIEDTLTRDAPGFIGLVTLVEIVWVLERLYKAKATEIHETIKDMLESEVLCFENRGVVTRALATARKTGSGFPDAVIAESAFDAGCDTVFSFDRRAERAGMTRVP